MKTFTPSRPRRPRPQSIDPSGPSPSRLTAPVPAEDPVEDHPTPILDLLWEGGLDDADLDRLLLAVRFDRPSVVGEILGLHPGRVSRLIRQLLDRAHAILQAATARAALAHAEHVTVDWETGEVCDDLRPEELIPVDAPRTAPLCLVELARVVRGIRRSTRACVTHLCAVREGDACRVWPASLPPDAWVLPFAAPQAAPESSGPILLPLRRAA